MNSRLYTLAVAHNDGPGAEIFLCERDALDRRLSFSEVSKAQRDRLLGLFDSADRPAFEEALDQLESELGLLCAIEAHEISRRDRLRFEC